MALEGDETFLNNKHDFYFIISFEYEIFSQVQKLPQRKLKVFNVGNYFSPRAIRYAIASFKSLI